MPSRRQFLATLGTASTGTLVGCSGYGTPTAGVVWQKRITVTTTRADDSETRTDVLRLKYDADAATVYGQYDPAHVAGAIGGTTVTVSPRLHASLTEEFVDVRYGVSVLPQDETTDPVNAAATRESFNEMVLGGRAAVSTYLGEDGYGYVRLYGTKPRQRTVSRGPIRTFDIDDVID